MQVGEVEIFLHDMQVGEVEIFLLVQSKYKDREIEESKDLFGKIEDAENLSFPEYYFKRAYFEGNLSWF